FVQDIGTASKDRHDQLVTECKRDAHVTFDWKSFRLEDWWVPDRQELHEQAAEWTCTEALLALAELCAHPVAKKKPLEVTAVKCRAVPCEKLPQKRDGGHSYPGFAFKVSGSELEMSMCPKSEHAREALRELAAR